MCREKMDQKTEIWKCGLCTLYSIYSKSGMSFKDSNGNQLNQT